MIGIGLFLLLTATHPLSAPVALPAPDSVVTNVTTPSDETLLQEDALVLDLSTDEADMEPAAQPVDRGKGCGRARQCSAPQVGQPCDPSNLNVICSQQSNGHYCCLAYAP